MSFKGHIKGKLPYQAVVNNMCVEEIPTELSSLEILEQILIAQRIAFEKIVVMPKEQHRKIKGAICNLPVECDQRCNQLSRPPDRSGIIMLDITSNPRHFTPAVREVSSFFRFYCSCAMASDFM